MLASLRTSACFCHVNKIVRSAEISVHEYEMMYILKQTKGRPNMCHYSYHRVDGQLLEDWLEDDGQFSRYAVGDEDSVWMCNECEHLEDNCECEDEDGNPVERY